MSLIAGVVSTGQSRPRPGAAMSILKDIVAPKQEDCERYQDRYIDIASRNQIGSSSVFADSNIVVAASCQSTTIKDLGRKLGINAAHQHSGRALALAFEKWGEATVENLTGEFAFAIWDKNTQTLFCARDRFGRRSLAYSITSTGIVFASDFLPIVANLPSPPVINDDWIIEFISGAASDERSTPFKDVMRLPPGCLLRWSTNEFSVRKYWSYNHIGSDPKGTKPAEILNALEASVHRRMTDPKVCAMLSGGLDSSSLAVLARDSRKRNNDPPLPTISLVFDKKYKGSDQPFINAVLRQGGFEPHFVHVEKFNPIAEIEDLLRVQGAPTIARGTPTFNQAVKRAAQLGFTSVIDGHGGDEIISSFGEMRLYELARDRKWLGLAGELFRTTKNSHLNFISNYSGFFAHYGEGASAKVFRLIHSRLRKSFRTQREVSILESDWESHPAVARSKSAVHALNPSRHLNERSFQESVLCAPIQTQALEFLDRQFRSKGLRIELPFWDYNVVECCLRVPSREKLKRGVPRSLIRSVIGDRLPTQIADRTSKFDFSDWFLHNMQSCETELMEIQLDRNNRAFDFVNHRAFVDDVTSLRSESKRVRSQSAKNIWSVLNLILWFDMVSKYQSKPRSTLEISC